MGAHVHPPTPNTHTHTHTHTDSHHGRPLTNRDSVDRGKGKRKVTLESRKKKCSFAVALFSLADHGYDFPLLAY